MEEIIRLQEYEPLWDEWRMDKFLCEGNLANVYQVKNKENIGVIKVISVPRIQGETGNGQSPENREQMNNYFREVVNVLEHEVSKLSILERIPNILTYKKYQAFERSSEIGFDFILLMDKEQSLLEYVASKKITNKEIVRIVKEVAEILEKTHNEDIIHKDIKVENIFIGKNGEGMLGDFALARKVESFQSRSYRKMDSVYTAPEVMSEYDYNVATDIYALGMVLYLLLNNGQVSAACNRRTFKTEVPKPERAKEKLATIALKAISYRAKDRYISAKEVYNALCELTEEDFEYPDEYIEAEEARRKLQEANLRKEAEERKAEEERLRKEEEEKKAEEERLRKEEEEKKAEEERLRKEEEEKKAEEERLRKEEEEKKAEEERLRKEEEEKKAEEERLRKEEEERKAEEERLRKEEEEKKAEEERLRKEEEEKKAEEERLREEKKAEEERLRKEEEEKKAEEERLRKEEEEKKAEEERLRKEEEERKAEEEERLRKEEEERKAEEERLRKEEEERKAEEERLRKEEEEKKAEEERLRKEEEEKKAEEERLRKEEEEKKAEEERLRKEKENNITKDSLDGAAIQLNAAILDMEKVSNEIGCENEKLGSNQDSAESVDDRERQQSKEFTEYSSVKKDREFLQEQEEKKLDKAIEESRTLLGKIEADESKPLFEIHADKREYSGFFNFEETVAYEERTTQKAYDESIDQEPFEQVYMNTPREIKTSKKPLIFIAILLIIIGAGTLLYCNEDTRTKIQDSYNKAIEYFEKKGVASLSEKDVLAISKKEFIVTEYQIIRKNGLVENRKLKEQQIIENQYIEENLRGNQ